MLNGGVASNAVLSGAGTMFVSSGGLATGTVLNNQIGSGGLGIGALVVLSGGTLSGTIVNSGGIVNVRTSGVEINGVVHGGGNIYVGFNTGGGTTFGDTLIGSGSGVWAFETVLSGAVASGTLVSNAGVLLVSSGGLATGTILAGVAASPIGSGATLVVSTGGIARGALVESGGFIDVRSGGVESGALVQGGGQIAVGVSSGFGATFGDTLIGSGSGAFAVEQLFSGAAASGTTVSNTGQLIVSSGGLAVGTLITATYFAGPNGGLFVANGGHASGATVMSGGLLECDRAASNPEHWFRAAANSLSASTPASARPSATR